MFKTTPDLSKHFSPQPKTFKAKKETKSIKPGKKTLNWEEGRPRLKVIFRENGITTCEIKLKICKHNNFLGFAHTRRRARLTQEQVVDPHFVVLGCNPCHEYVDFKMDRKKAEELLDGIVAARGW